MSAGRLTLEIVELDRTWQEFLPDIDALVAAAIAALAAERTDLAGTAILALASDAEVQALNHRFRQKNKPTNVLSFPARDLADHSRLGDIVLARQTIAGEASDLSLPTAHHLQHLVVHGLLHLLGFDHETDTDAEVMEAIETRVLGRLGIADPYKEPPIRPAGDTRPEREDRR